MELVLSGLTLLDLVSQQREAFPHESHPATTKTESGWKMSSLFFLRTVNAVWSFPVSVSVCFTQRGAGVLFIYFIHIEHIFPFAMECSAAEESDKLWLTLLKSRCVTVLRLNRWATPETATNHLTSDTPSYRNPCFKGPKYYYLFISIYLFQRWWNACVRSPQRFIKTSAALLKSMQYLQCLQSSLWQSKTLVFIHSCHSHQPRLYSFHTSFHKLANIEEHVAAKESYLPQELVKTELIEIMDLSLTWTHPQMKAKVASWMLTYLTYWFYASVNVFTAFGCCCFKALTITILTFESMLWEGFQHVII